MCVFGLKGMEVCLYEERQSDFVTVLHRSATNVKYQITGSRVSIICHLFRGDVYVHIVGTLVVTHRKHLKHLSCT